MYLGIPKVIIMNKIIRVLINFKYLITDLQNIEKIFFYYQKIHCVYPVYFYFDEKKV